MQLSKHLNCMERNSSLTCRSTSTFLILNARKSGQIMTLMFGEFSYRASASLQRKTTCSRISRRYGFACSKTWTFNGQDDQFGEIKDVQIVVDEKDPSKSKGKNPLDTSKNRPTALKSSKAMPLNWDANHYALTRKLIEELKKPENASVLISDEMTTVSFLILLFRDFDPVISVWMFETERPCSQRNRKRNCPRSL